MNREPIPVSRWSVDYEHGAQPVILPHAWGQDVPLAWEGPATYQTELEVPRGDWRLRFWGVSYAAEVWVDGTSAATHRGIWDAFDVTLAPGKHTIEVRVTKNGGPAYPLAETLAGELAQVHHTFGGIFRPVELVPDESAPLTRPFSALPPRVRISGGRLRLDGTPFLLRGVRHAGWYPELGYPGPSPEAARDEVAELKRLGFNLVRFAGWLPPKSYLEVLEREGLVAWLDLPALTAASPEALASGIAEIERIVRQYRDQPSVVGWSVRGGTPEVSGLLARTVRNLTGCELVVDQGSPEAAASGERVQELDLMADPTDVPLAVNALVAAPSSREALLLTVVGVDVHRDLARIGDELPYWGSSLPELNDPGTRVRNDLPRVVADSRFSNEPTKSRHKALMESSRQQAHFLRKWTAEFVRSRGAVAGAIMADLRDTPVASAGFLDDWGVPRFRPEECVAWNGPDVLFLASAPTHPVVRGRRRTTWSDPYNAFAGRVRWCVGCHSEKGLQAGLVWHVVDLNGQVVARGAEAAISCEPLDATIVSQVDVDLTPGEYRLEVEFGSAMNAWPIWVVPSETTEPDARIVCLGDGPGTHPASFWGTATYEFRNDEFWSSVPFAGRWQRLLPVAGEGVLDASWLRENVGEVEVLMNRIDLHTYDEAPVLVRADGRFFTTLRPEGGLGMQPQGLERNAAGVALLRALQAALGE